MTRRGRTERSLAAALLLGAALLGPGCGLTGESEKQQLRASARERVDDAKRLAEEGDLEAALRQFALAIEENPTLTTAYVGMADVHRVRGDYQAAEVGYRAAAELEPRNFDAQYRHGLVLQLLDRLTEAVRAYVRALSIRPNDFDANLNLATAYLDLGEPGQALFYAIHATELNTRSGPARVNLAAVYFEMGRYDDAVRQYQTAAELMELTPDLLLSLADALGRAGRHREMLNTLGELVRREESAQAYERLGYAYFRLNMLDDALKAFRSSVELDERHYPALNGVGVCLLNRYLLSDRADLAARDEAIRALRRSLRIKRDQTRIVELLSRYS